jgi:hypothetical protein
MQAERFSGGVGVRSVGAGHARSDEGIYAVFSPTTNNAVYNNYFMVSTGMFINIPGNPPS